MQADVLPSYQQATSRGDWLQLAAPCIAFTDYPSLCCVNRHFWSVFAPLIWKDPGAASGCLGWREDSDAVSWWAEFIECKLDSLTARTRALVRVLDARATAGEFRLYLGLTEDAVIRALGLLPNLQSVLLDNNPSLELRFQRSNTALNGQLKMSLLSIKDCPNGVPIGLIKNYALRGLVFLDVSGIASVTPQLLEPVYLPELRILKLCRQGINSTAFAGFSAVLGHRVWSLDLSNNKLTDDAFQHKLNAMFLNNDLRSDARSQTEGSLEKLPVSTRSHGQFFMLHETAQSILFVPDDRYLADTPPYTAPNATDNVMTRSDGSIPVRLDTADGVSRLLSLHDAIDTAYHVRNPGLTHLHLSGNQFSAFAIERMLRESHGQLEHFDCDSMRLFPPSAVKGHLRPSNAMQLDGFSGMSHIFRPVWSSNLRSLRIHHSLVTNIPSLRCSRYSSLECAYLAEMQIHARLDLAYPLAFVPDMNPRLESLTLTCVPRHSFGPLIQILISFLQQLGLQESHVMETNKAEASRPGKPLRLVRGLRILTLEMEAACLDTSDAEHLMTSDETQYSFFDSPIEETPLSPKPHLDVWSAPDKSRLKSPVPTVQPWDAYNPMPRSSGRDGTTDQWVVYQPEDGSSDAIVVWAGNPEAPNPVVQLYNHLVINYGLKEGAGPVNLTQQRAGAPWECVIFHTVWLYAALPQRIQPPQAAVLQDETRSKSKHAAATLRQLRVPTRRDFERARKADPNTMRWYWGGTLRIIDSE
ncbi:hypothetical protein ACQKWADRAFT_318340 [Trichoderma austrokoningii]